MKIAITTENQQVFGHFGKSRQFTVYTTENNRIIHQEVVPCEVQGHGAIPAFLKELGIDTVICHNLGDGAKEALKAAEIELVAGADGNIDKVITAYLSGDLKHNPNTACGHHHEHHN
jgi:predicted Fe-Mo cluster-binding NifX family protein